MDLFKTLFGGGLKINLGDLLRTFVISRLMSVDPEDVDEAADRMLTISEKDIRRLAGLAGKSKDEAWISAQLAKARQAGDILGDIAANVVQAKLGVE